jgi:hypothetical protein
MINCGVRELVDHGFLQPDPLWETNRAWSPYQYGLANKLLHRDITGADVDISGLEDYVVQGVHRHNELYSGEIIWELQQITGLTLYIDNGCLKADLSKGWSGGSKLARDKLIEMIESKDVFPLKISFKQSTRVPNENKNTIYFNPNQMSGFMQSAVGVNRLTMGWGMTLFHEYFHTKAGGGVKDPPRGHMWMVKSDADEFPNEIRSELGPDWGERVSYGAKEIDGVHYLPMTKDAMNTLEAGKIPESGYILSQGDIYEH